MTTTEGTENTNTNNSDCCRLCVHTHGLALGLHRGRSAALFWCVFNFHGGFIVGACQDERIHGQEVTIQEHDTKTSNRMGGKFLANDRPRSGPLHKSTHGCLHLRQGSGAVTDVHQNNKPDRPDAEQKANPLCSPAHTTNGFHHIIQSAWKGLGKNDNKTGSPSTVKAKYDLMRRSTSLLMRRGSECEGQ